MNINPESLYRAAQSASAPAPSSPSRRLAAPAEGVPGPRDDTLSFSARAEAYLSARTQLERAPEVSRAERVATLAGLIARGEYTIDTAALADDMLADDATAWALGFGPAR